MTRTARPRGSLGTVALLAVLAITTGWNLPPTRPTAAAAALGGVWAGTVPTIDAPAPDAAAAAGRTRARLARETWERATAWAVAWDSRDSGLAFVEPDGDAAPTETSADSSLLPGARSDASRMVEAAEPPKAYRGTNHFWIPTLGMSTPIMPFPCPRKRPPDNYMYRWGCAKQNNVYILGHAYSVMKPLYNAYMSGRLHVGMVAIYADGNGRIRTYRVTEWRVVDPAEGVHWAIAAQPVPSMTLQTCVGRYSQWRLNVRLVAID